MSGELRMGLPFPHLVREAAGAGEGGARPPLVVLLHGYGSTAQGMMGVAPSLDERFVVAVPQAPVRLGDVGWGWYPLGQGPVAPVLSPERLERSRRGVLDFAAQAARRYGADPERVFLVGFSQGAALALAVALTEPERLAGVVAMSGRVVPEILPQVAAPERVARLPVLVTHGRDDQVVPAAQGRAAAEMLERMGCPVRYLEVAAAHAVPADLLSEVSRWLVETAETPGSRGA